MFRSQIWKSDSFLFFYAFITCTLFFAAYSTLSIVRHNHYGSFGYDLGINNQVVWKYSNFKIPITTSAPFPTESKLVTHIELIYALIAPFYWIWNTAKMLLLLEAFFVCSSGLAIYLLARKVELHISLCFALLFSYLAFYGVQNAMWFDVHSASFAAAFLAWFLYCLESKKNVLSVIFFILAITSKENIALLTLLISLLYFVKRRDIFTSIFMIISVVYLGFIYLVYFPYISHHEYLYQNKNGLLSNLNPVSIADTVDKRDAIFYSLASFGFIPLALPLYLLPTLGDLTTYFVIASDLTASHGLALHYRITIAPLLVWATIMAIKRYKRLNNPYIAVYLLFWTLVVQFVLHLPLSYLSKTWFWTEPSSVKHINSLRKYFSQSDSIVAQNNIIPHISRRDKVYTLYPEKKKFSEEKSPCGKELCDWFRWEGQPKYLYVDTSSDWDARHLLEDRADFIQGLENITKSGIVTKYKQSESAVLYKVNKSP